MTTQTTKDFREGLATSYRAAADERNDAFDFHSQTIRAERQLHSLRNNHERSC